MCLLLKVLYIHNSGDTILNFFQKKFSSCDRICHNPLLRYLQIQQKEMHTRDVVIKNCLEQMKAGRKQPHKNLALYPLLSTCSVGLEYLMLDEALSENLIEIVEKDDGGSVSEVFEGKEATKMGLQA